MATDYSVIIHVRQQFGDEADNREVVFETQAPFVGGAKNFPFVCENIDRSQPAVLQFQSMGVSHRRNIIRINGFDIPGGLYPSIDTTYPLDATNPFTFQVWNSNTLLIAPFYLQENNVLRIESRNSDGGTSDNRDNFIIDNMVVLFKTRQPNPFELSNHLALKR